MRTGLRQYLDDWFNGKKAESVDDIHRVLKVTFNIKDYDDRESIIVNIQSQAQIYLAANVAGCKAGVHEDKKGTPIWSCQNHKLAEPIKYDWSIIREMIESMFGPEQSPYVYAWLQWAYVSYESRTLASKRSVPLFKARTGIAHLRLASTL